MNEFDGFTKMEWYHYNATGHSEIANLLATHGDFGSGSSPTGNGAVDIAFVIDTTGSMGSAIASVKIAATQLVNTVSVQTAGARFALVDYRDFPSRTGASYDYPALLDQDFTSDPTTINTAIQSLVLGFGGDLPQTMYSGINMAFDLAWRPGAKKMVIVLADAPPLSPEPFTGLTGIDIILRALTIDPAEVHIVDVGGATNSSEMQDVAARTNGGIYRSSPSQAATQIAAAIDSSLQRPYAWAAGPYVGVTGTTFTFDGRGSYGIAAPIVKYEWDVDSDGTYEYASAADDDARLLGAVRRARHPARHRRGRAGRALDRGCACVGRRRRDRAGRGQLPRGDQPRPGGRRRRRRQRHIRRDVGLPQRGAGEAGDRRQRRHRRPRRRLDAAERHELPTRRTSTSARRSGRRQDTADYVGVEHPGGLAAGPADRATRRTTTSCSRTSPGTVLHRSAETGHAQREDPRDAARRALPPRRAAEAGAVRRRVPSTGST